VPGTLLTEYVCEVSGHTVNTPVNPLGCAADLLMVMHLGALTKQVVLAVTHNVPLVNTPGMVTFTESAVVVNGFPVLVPSVILLPAGAV
jgi:hypothetical protein